MNVHVGQTSALGNLTLTEAADAVARGEVSSVELTKSALSAIAARDKIVNSFIWLDEEEALSTAAALDAMQRAGRRLGPLHGVPLAHKDMYYRKGKRSTCGSKIRAEFRPTYTATVIERLEGAGSISIGGLNMAEFAQNATGHNQHYGHCGNPWNAAYCPGGSSSGSGSAVGARLVYAALGSDTGGSIRLPASLCGVTGIKGTQTRVSRYGVMPLSFSADNVGPLARSARDCARIMNVIAGYDTRDPTSSSEPVPDYEAALTGDIRGMAIGVPTNYFFDGVDPDVMRAFESAVETLKQLGAVIMPVTIPHMDAITTYGSILSRVEGATIHAQWMRERPQDYAIHLNARLYASYGIPATAYVEALARRGELLKEVAAEVLNKVSAFLCPTIRIKAPTLKQSDVDAGTEGAIEYFNNLSVNTRPMNYLGVPSVSLPCGLDSNGMPIGLQIQGRPFAEGTILKIADAFQRTTDHHRKLPPMLA
jgi:aspartyl-tRNA(Asn)/glutamyl-tRNA(Gln) amidotransferase subunit A